MQTLTYAFRTLRRSPGFTTVAIMLLALGIGANSAVFSVVYAVLLRPLPYPEPQRLVQLKRAGGLSQVSGPEHAIVKEQTTAFSAVAIYRDGGEHRLSKGPDAGGADETVVTMYAGADFLRTLAVAPEIGREFQVEETRPNGPRSTILSDAVARRIFGDSRMAVGGTVAIDGNPYSVVGVLPQGFWIGYAPDVLLPHTFSDDMGANSTLIARLKPTVTLSRAAAELSTLTGAMKLANPRGLARTYSGLEPVALHDQLSGDVRTDLLLLFGAVGALLLIACSNLASLLLARLSTRRKEIAVRLALGSGSVRLFQQFLVENTLLGVAGGLAGLLVGNWMLDGLLALAPFRIPSSTPLTMNFAALALTSAAAMGATFAGSLLPLWAATRMNVGGALKAGSRAIQGEARQWTRNVLVVCQVAASATLLVSAALLIESLYHLRQEELGFKPEGLLTFTTPVPAERRGKQAEIQRAYTTLFDTLRGLPGVRSVAGINVLPLSGPNNFPSHLDGRPEQSIGGMEIRQVTPEYFATMGIPILRGRALGSSDTATSPQVMLVSETVARTWWPNGNPLGGKVAIGNLPGREIVGVVADTKVRSVREPAKPTVYVPLQQWEAGGMSWVVQGNVSSGQIRDAVRQIDPRQRLERIRTMEEIALATTATSRFDAWLFGGMALLALLLTSVGVYGLLAYSVVQRTHEIGTRMALGASSAQVLTLILKQGGLLLVVGSAIGLAIARNAADLLGSLLYGAEASDWNGYVAAVVTLLIAGLAASYIPARRAAKVDPLAALRCDD